MNLEYDVTELRIDQVKVVNRHRRDLGDLDDLAQSINRNGVLHPITVNADGVLITGQRRLEASRRLGHSTIRAQVVKDLNGAAARLVLERDENTCRKPMTPEELVSLGRALEGLEKPKAMERMAEAGRSAAPFRPAGRADDKGVEKSAHLSSGRTRDVVAGILGWSGFTYERAKKVVAAASDPTLPPERQAVAKEALEDMNRTGRVSGSYARVVAKEPPPGEEVHVPVPRPVLHRAAHQRRALASAASTLSGLAHGLRQIEELHPEITSDEAAQWVGDLVEARQVLTVMIKRLKERTNDQA